MEVRSFNVKLERNEWVMLNFILGYKTKIVIWITIVGLAMLYTVIDYLTLNSFNTNQFPLGQLLFAVLILVVIPVSTYFRATKMLETNPWIRETAHYFIGETSISIKGDTYEVSIHWINIKSIEELKNWIVIYSEAKRGFFIPKRIFSKEELVSLKKALELVPAQKIKLK
ncbi:MAG: YcxB family protein [Flavobacteriales bacterium]|nr:YcxB family protein [Flavobacteriales bacterium]